MWALISSALSSFRNWLYLLQRKAWGAQEAGAEGLGERPILQLGPKILFLRIICQESSFLLLGQSKTAGGKVCSICTEAEDVRSTVLQSETDWSSWVRKIVPKLGAFLPAYVVQIVFCLSSTLFLYIVLHNLLWDLDK